MSDQNRDTSRGPFNKNPLLSANITGLTFDDFTNKAIILPAAALPPKLPEPKDIRDTEPTKPVIFGNEPAILDTETFSEISLDQPSDVETYPTPPNPLLDEQFNTEYSKTFNPLTQATHLTASLSQLPSVASSVFSSFSNILRGNSPTPNSSHEQPQSIEPYNAFPDQPYRDDSLINSSSPYQTEESAVPVVAPIFYSTNDPAFPPPAPTLSPPPLNTSSGNAYRLTTKRKIYAPAPGLSHQENQPVPTSAFTAQNTFQPLPQPVIEPHFQVNQPAYQNTNQPPLQNIAVDQPPLENIAVNQPQIQNIAVNQPSYQNTAVKQPSSQSNKFSLTSFFSTPLLEKITGSSVNQPQETYAAPVQDVFNIQSTHSPAPVNFVNPALFNTQPVSGNIQPSFHPEHQPSVATLISSTPPLAAAPLAAPPPLFFSQQELVTADNISSIPPTTIPPSGSATNYRLKGKPHYKNPLSSTTTTTPLVLPFAQAPPSHTPTVGLFNPGSSGVASNDQVQSTINPPRSIDPSCFPSQELSSSIDFFNQPQYTSVDSQSRIFNQFSANTSGYDPTNTDFPTNNSGLFEQPPFASKASQIHQGQLQPTQQNHGEQHPQLQLGQIYQGHFQPTQQSSGQHHLGQLQPNQLNLEQIHQGYQGQVQPTQQHLGQQQQELGQQHLGEQQPNQLQQSHLQPSQLQQIQQQQEVPIQQPAHQQILSGQLPPVQHSVEEIQQFQAQGPNSDHQTGHFQQSESISEFNQPQQPQFQHLETVDKEIEFQLPNQLQQPSQFEDSVKELQPLLQQPPCFDPFTSTSSFSQNIETPISQSSNSNIFSNFQHPPQSQIANFFPTESSDLNQYSTEHSRNVLTQSNTDEIVDNTETKFTNLNLNNPVQSDFQWEATSVRNLGDSEQANIFGINSDQEKDAVKTESSNPSNFDKFFSQLSQPEHSEILKYPETQPVATSAVASNFFSTPSNSSHADWFNSSQGFEPSTNSGQFESDINRNTTEAPVEVENNDPNTFFTTNNNQTATNSSQPNYFQIQNFFNNPPLISDSKEQDSNFNFIENNLINKRLHNLTHKASVETDGGSVSSNIVEPPSSAQSQSEFSEFAEINPAAQSDEYLGEQQFSVESPITTNMATTTDQTNGGPAATEISNVVYRPVYKHWFYNKTVSDQKPTWTPFPMNDSLNLEEAFNSNSNQFITTNGGRYDVNIETRKRSPIYWNGASDEVRRCSWFYKGADSRLVPYDEDVSDLLEEEYRVASQSGEWNRKITIPSGEVVVFQAPSVMVHFLAAQTPDLWPNTTMPQAANRPRVVKRGVDEFNIEDGEPEQIDHLLFMVHGIGAGCDLKFRSVEEVVEDFRAIALQLTQSHYRSACDRGNVGRIEILPVSWHAELHSEESGIDEKLKAITLESIPKLRTFTNDTLLDILFYSSPVFCQKIMDTVAGTINRMYIKYCERNPNFKGNVSLAGHSLGSLILFDLLQNQTDTRFENKSDVDCSPVAESSDENSGIRPHKPLSRTRSRKINYTIGTAGTGQPFINYPQLVFHPKKFFALGSPIGMFVTIRGVDNLGLNYKLPTTDGFYNIFHPYDPVAYRIEALVNNELIPLRPVLIPHHKGRKRMHLELRETMARVGADIKQKIIDTFKSVYNFASLQKNDPKTLQQEVDKVLEQQLALEASQSSQTQRTRACSTSTTSSDTDNGETEFSLGILNEGKRIDYVLQEAPLEFFNEYLFALTSHVCYWDSADTILFIVKEIYTALGMQTDSQIPQQSMTIERPTTVSPTPVDS